MDYFSLNFSIAELCGVPNGAMLAEVRVRILRQPTGDVDGVELWKLIEGRTYDVNSSLATLLIVSQWAEPVAEDRPALVVPVDHPNVMELLDRRRTRERAAYPRRRRRSDQ